MICKPDGQGIEVPQGAANAKTIVAALPVTNAEIFATLSWLQVSSSGVIIVAVTSYGDSAFRQWTQDSSIDAKVTVNQFTATNCPA